MDQANVFSSHGIDSTLSGVAYLEDISRIPSSNTPTYQHFLFQAG